MLAIYMPPMPLMPPMPCLYVNEDIVTVELQHNEGS